MSAVHQWFFNLLKVQTIPFLGPLSDEYDFFLPTSKICASSDHNLFGRCLVWVGHFLNVFQVRDLNSGYRLDTGTIGPLTIMSQFAKTFGNLSSTVHGLVVSTILITAAMASFFGGHVANSLGRLKCVALGAAIFGTGAAIEAGSVKLSMLVTGRAVKGAGEGLFLSTSVVLVVFVSTRFIC
jgi:MFS family permease